MTAPSQRSLPLAVNVQAMPRVFPVAVEPNSSLRWGPPKACSSPVRSSTLWVTLVSFTSLGPMTSNAADEEAVFPRTVAETRTVLPPVLTQ